MRIAKRVVRSSHLQTAITVQRVSATAQVKLRSELHCSMLRSTCDRLRAQCEARGDKGGNCGERLSDLRYQIVHTRRHACSVVCAAATIWQAAAAAAAAASAWAIAGSGMSRCCCCCCGSSSGSGNGIGCTDETTGQHNLCVLRACGISKQHMHARMSPFKSIRPF